MVHLWSGGVAYEVEGTVFDPTVGQIKRMGSGSDAGLYILVIASRLRPPPFRGFTIGCREMVAGKSVSASVPQWRLWAPPPGMQRHYQGKLAMVNLWTGGVAYDVGRKGIRPYRQSGQAHRFRRWQGDARPASSLAALLCCNQCSARSRTLRPHGLQSVRGLHHRRQVSRCAF